MRSVVNHLLQFPLRWKLDRRQCAAAFGGAGGAPAGAAGQPTERAGGARGPLRRGRRERRPRVSGAGSADGDPERGRGGDQGRLRPARAADAPRRRDADARAAYSTVSSITWRRRTRACAAWRAKSRTPGKSNALAVAHELREGVAQMLFALKLELGATAREHGEPLAGAARARGLCDGERGDGGRAPPGRDATPPAALTELGIKPALETLVRRVSADQGRADGKCRGRSGPRAAARTWWRKCCTAWRSARCATSSRTARRSGRSIVLRRRGADVRTRHRGRWRRRRSRLARSAVGRTGAVRPARDAVAGGRRSPIRDACAASAAHAVLARLSSPVRWPHDTRTHPRRGRGRPHGRARRPQGGAAERQRHHRRG